jgi:hypothetical protein
MVAMDDRLQLSVGDIKLALGERSGEGRAGTVFEDRGYAITLHYPESLGQATVYVEDYVLDRPTEVRSEDGVMVCHWQQTDVFRNCFGLTAFRVEFSQGSTVYSPYIEVLSRKISPEEIMAMVRYLQSRAERIIQVGFAKTGLGMAPGGSTASIERAVDVAEEAVAAIEDLLVVRPSRIRRRLVERRVVKGYEPRDPVDDRSITYVLENLDKGALSPDPEKHALPVDLSGRRLYFSELDVVHKQESTDVYENRIIHGFLRSMHHRLGEIRSYLQEVYRELDRYYLEGAAEQSEEYTSFLSVCGYHVGRISRQTLDRIATLLERIRINEWRAQQLIPAKPLQEMPRNTPWFAVYPRYRRVFVSAQQWYMIRDEFSDLSRFLLRLRTIDRLYECVCLFQLVELFEAEGWQLHDASMMGLPGPLWGEMNNCYRFRSAEGELELLWEPPIPPHGSGEHLWNRVKVSGDSERFFAPDFLVRITHRASGKECCIVLDAKYGSEKSVFQHHLPKVVLKYTYGVAKSDELSQPPFQHTWVLAPIGRLLNYQWQLPEAGFKRTTVGVVGILPEARDVLRKWYREVVLKSLS